MPAMGEGLSLGDGNHCFIKGSDLLKPGGANAAHQLSSKKCNCEEGKGKSCHEV